MTADCLECEQPITGQPVADPEHRRWLPPQSVPLFCSEDCLAQTAERNQCSG